MRDLHFLEIPNLPHPNQANPVPPAQIQTKELLEKGNFEDYVDDDIPSALNQIYSVTFSVNHTDSPFSTQRGVPKNSKT